jgi:hypothetical protein
MKLNSFILIFTIAALTACSSASIQSTKDTQKVRKLERLYVVVDHGTSPDLAGVLVEKLQEQLKTKPLKTEFISRNPLELDEKAPLAKAKRFNADSLLVVKLLEGTKTEYGGYAELKYDVSLYNPDMKDRWWRAVVENSGGTAMMAARMEKMSKNIVNRLSEDGFLPQSPTVLK